MAEKIARFKQALRAKTNAKKKKSTEDTVEESLFQKELQKYALQQEKTRKEKPPEKEKVSGKENTVNGPSLQATKKYPVIFTQCGYLILFSSLSKKSREKNTAEGKYVS